MTNVKNRVLKLVSRAGAGHTALRLYDAFTDYTGTVDDSVRQFDQAVSDNGHVVFPLIPGYRTIALRYCILADAFRRRGYNPILLIDDLTDVPVERSIGDDQTITLQTSYFEKQIPKNFGLEVTGLSEFVSSDEVNLDESRDTIERFNIEEYALGSVRRRFKVHTIDLDDPKMRREYENFLSLGVLVARAVKQIMTTHETELLVVHEPYYVQGGVPMAVARDHGVTAYSQGFGFREGTLIFGGRSERSALPHFTREDVVRDHLRSTLSEEEMARIDEIMYGRESGKGMAVDYSAHTNRSVTSGDVVSIGMFTNLLWDASLEPENALYANVFEWISDTIRAFETTEEAELVIKTHPAEAKFGTHESVAERVREEFSSLPDNVTLLPPDTDVDTYALINSLDAAVVYNSTVGLESAYRGVPVIVTGETHYRDYGFTIDPGTKREYLDLISNPDRISLPTETEALARRYAHLLMVKRHTPFPFFVRDETQRQQFKEITIDDTRPGAEPLESLLSSMLAGDEVLNSK
ncbi:capsular polysaccharide export protein, LipB/KpsS family [Haloferax profundi]|uniref:Capsule biosynthesis protein n=1 Tax=Haloferax profundi TaxID=1544718 RepID=A0A0W1SWX5_9EURY|nr:hypothetical protein [Haloferax profundi]KTG30925.1 hypothetical protein AUR66_05570 [Haloferax profundi]